MARKILIALGVVLLTPIVLWCASIALLVLDVVIRLDRHELPNGAWFEIRPNSQFSEFSHYRALVRLMHPDGRVLVERTIGRFCYDDDVVEGYAVVPNPIPEMADDRYFYYRRGAADAVVIPLKRRMRADTSAEIGALSDKPCGGHQFCMADFSPDHPVRTLDEANRDAVGRCARDPAL